VEQAIDYAHSLGCHRLNCLAGLAPTDATTAQARDTLIDNLRFAASTTAQVGIELVIEPLNTRDNSGYFVPTTRAGLEIIAAVGSDNLRLQYDIYHAQVMEGDLARTLEANLPRIGHIQFADNPGRHEPGTGEINFEFLFRALSRMGYPGWVSAEYRPSGRTEDTLGWLERARS
jgi:hydroxypyruvate isomerase